MALFPASVRRWLTEHPRSVGESYCEHARVAAGFALAMIGGGTKCLIHAAIPALFPTAASDRVRALHAELDRRRAAAASYAPDYII